MVWNFSKVCSSFLLICCRLTGKEELLRFEFQTSWNAKSVLGWLFFLACCMLPQLAGVKIAGASFHTRLLTTLIFRKWDTYWQWQYLHFHYTVSVCSHSWFQRFKWHYLEVLWQNSYSEVTSRLICLEFLICFSRMQELHKDIVFTHPLYIQSIGETVFQFILGFVILFSSFDVNMSRSAVDIRITASTPETMTPSLHTKRNGILGYCESGIIWDGICVRKQFLPEFFFFLFNWRGKHYEWFRNFSEAIVIQNFPHFLQQSLNFRCWHSAQLKRSCWKCGDDGLQYSFFESLLWNSVHFVDFLVELSKIRGNV